MAILKGIMILIEVFVSIMLVSIILVQRSKDEGLGLAFGSGVGETLFGSRAGNVLTKITVGLAVVFLLNTTLLALIYTRMGASSGALVERMPMPAASSRPIVPPAGPAPAAPMLPAADAGAPAPASTPAPAVPAAPATP
jgi:preprotein translocase subunit SecG